MITRQLGFLVALAREGHFGRAAQACNISQPGLSSAIRQLEEELGVPIIDRSQRFKGFTPEGEIVLDWARRMLGDYHTMKQQLRLATGSLRGTLIIGGISSVMPLLSILTNRLCDRFPEISVSAQSLNESQIEKGLSEFEYHVGFTFLSRVQTSRFRTLPLYRERYVFLTPESGALADRRELSWSEAVETPLCLLSGDSHTRRSIDTLCEKAGCVAAPQIETNSILVLLSHVAAGRWATILPQSVLYPLGVPRGTRPIRLPNQVEPEELGLVTLDREPLPPLVKALFALAEQTDVAAELDAAIGSARRR